MTRLAAGFVDFERATPVMWCDIAFENNLNAHRLMHWSEIAPASTFEAGKGGVSPPLEGDITEEMVDLLFKILIDRTGKDQECVCAFWEGYGGGDDIRAAGVEGVGQQQHLLFSASLGEIKSQWREALERTKETSGMTPNAVWPTTNEWYFAVPFERQSSYLGGSLELIREVSTTTLETYEAFPDDNI